MDKIALRERALYRITLWGALVNVLLLIFKYTAGILGRSSAMVADATHSLSDFMSDVVVVVFLKLSSKPRDDQHQYGHGKYETFATLIVGVILFFVALYLFLGSLQSIINWFEGAELQQPGRIALIAALLSILLKEWLYRITLNRGKKHNSSSVIANAWHHRSDAFSSIGTAIGIAGATLLGARWAVLDPAAAVIVSFFIFKAAFSIAMPSINELLEHALPEETRSEIMEIVTAHPALSHPHNLRTRKIGNAVAIEFHVRVNGEMSVTQSHALISNVEKQLRNRFGNNTYISIHIEPEKR